MLNTPHKPTRARSAKLRHFALPFAWICLLAHMSGFAHVILVRHVMCSEHGALVEGQANHHHRVAQLPNNASTHHIEQAHASAVPHHDVDHDHCVIASLQRNQLTRAHAALIVVVPSQLAVSPYPARAGPIHVIASYALAPKTSPPRV